MKYALFDKCIIHIDDNNIVKYIIRHDDTKTYKKLGSGKMTFILDKELPQVFNEYLYDSIEILKKAKKLINNDIINNSGVCTEYFENGKIRKNYFSINDMKQGIYKEYHPNGNLFISCSYIDNKFHGLYNKFNSNGQLLVELTFNNNVANGISKKYNYIGEFVKSEEYTYTNNILNGPYTILFRDIITIGIYENNLIIESVTTENNIIIEKIYKNPDDIGYIYEQYYNTYQLKEKSIFTYENNDKKFINIVKYYQNGNIYIHKNLKDNTEISYFQNGNLQSKSFYENDDRITISYFENGNIKIKNIVNNNYSIDEIYNNNNVLIEYKYIQAGDIIFQYYIKNTILDTAMISTFINKLSKSIK